MTEMDLAALKAQVTGQAANDILTVGGLGLAGGLAVRGAMGLPGFFGRRPSKTLDRGPGPSIVTVPTPVYATAADQNRAARLKMASPSILKTAFGRGDIPWYYPGMAVAGLGGAAGGYGLMIHIMNSKEKSDLQSEEEVARQEYQKAMLEQYDPKLLPTADRVPLSTLPKVQKELSTAPAMPALKMASAGTMDTLDELTPRRSTSSSPRSPRCPRATRRSGGSRWRTSSARWSSTRR
jgi:hypothetical protein